MTKQKLYRVRFEDITGINDYYLNYDTSLDYWSIDDISESKTYRTSFTKKELEEKGFGWVFTSLLVDVEEVDND